MKVLDNGQWVEQQFSSCQLGNRLRTKRLQKVARNSLDQPEQSLPAQNTNWADLKAAYRLFAAEKVTFDAISTPHWSLTRRTSAGRYVLPNDTTDIDHYSHKATTGLGMLGKGDGRGMQLHNCLMYDCQEQQIRGVAGALVYYRKPAPKNEKRMQRLNRKRESDIWGALVDKVGSPPEGSQWIHVFDRGGDNFEAMCHIRLAGCDWVIRAARLNRNVIDKNGEKTPLKTVTEDAQVLGRYQLALRSRPNMKARTAMLEVSAAPVTYIPPRHHSRWVKKCGIAELPMHVVVVREVDAPKGVTPIQWVLLTSLPVRTFQDAWQVIEDYETRWIIEEYHKAIKTGCSIERHALRKADRLEPLIGLLAVVGVRLMQLKYLGRHQPEAKARTHIPATWLRALHLARPKLRKTGLTVYTFFRELAKMGGFLGRKGDGEPGWQTTWRGYRKLQNILDALQLTGAI